jgi:hypothetical protein
MAKICRLLQCTWCLSEKARALCRRALYFERDQGTLEFPSGSSLRSGVIQSFFSQDVYGYEGFIRFNILNLQLLLLSWFEEVAESNLALEKLLRGLFLHGVTVCLMLNA